ncbi:hypothetical protein EYF80_042919 [Liparis tanakae]|uniref:Uncharacterized protein n=1 Tax=Liparis tanakae TaxID=230148 RepID=A0A4Z2G1T4_9TELE|nr:hypothetical protein EYF80_042919 [Liparis tanakae]
MEAVAARMAMVTDSPNLSLRSRTTVTTDGESYVSSASLACSHFLSANVINVEQISELAVEEVWKGNTSPSTVDLNSTCTSSEFTVL